MSYQRFLLKMPECPVEEVVMKLRLFKFKPLHERGIDNESQGWVSFNHEYDHEKNIEASDLYFDHKIIFSFRLDSISLPKPLLKSLVNKSLQAYRRDHGKMPDKTIRKELELAEAQALRQRCLPKTKIVEVAWDLKTGDFRIFSTSQPMIDRVISLFKSSFLVSPQKIDYAFAAYNQALKEQNISYLDSISLQNIFTPPQRVDYQ